MATLHGQESSVITTLTSGAMDLLDCFGDEVGDFVMEVAEGFAKKRIGEQPTGNVIEVNEQDVRAAGEFVMSAIRKMAESGDLSPEAVSHVESMDSCMKSKLP